MLRPYDSVDGVFARNDIYEGELPDVSTFFEPAAGFGEAPSCPLQKSHISKYQGHLFPMQETSYI
jgi:hypothetical protein